MAKKKVVEAPIEEIDEDLVDDLEVDLDDDDVIVGLDDDEEDLEIPDSTVAIIVEGEIEGSEDEDDDLDDDEVEAGLDDILKERLVVVEEQADDDDEDEPGESDDRGDGSTRVLPKQPGEFV